MHVMAVAATYQSLIYLVVKRHRERRLDAGVTLVAEIRLCRHQQRCVRNRLVDTVAAQTAHTRLRMRRAQEVGVGVSVATQAGLINFAGCQLVEANNFGDIATAIDVCLAWTVAALTGVALAAMLQSEFCVRIVCHAIGNHLVAGRAGVIANVSVGGCSFGNCTLLQSLGLGLRLSGRHAGAACGHDPDHCNQKEIFHTLAGHLSHTVTPLLARSCCCVLLEIGLDLNSCNHSRHSPQYW